MAEIQNQFPISSINNFNDSIPQEIIHEISPCDTLVGLSLQYDVPTHKIKVHNNLHSDEIYYLKQIIIPNPQSISSHIFSKEDEIQSKNNIILQYFMTLVNPEDSKDIKMGRFYLEDAEYDVQKAFQNYKNDCFYEENQKKSKKKPLFSDKKGHYFKLKNKNN